jgi:hypothetical protein
MSQVKRNIYFIAREALMSCLAASTPNRKKNPSRASDFLQLNYPLGQNFSLVYVVVAKNLFAAMLRYSSCVALI